MKTIFYAAVIAIVTGAVAATPSGPLAAQSYQIQKPGPIQVPKGPWQKPGAIQVPKGIQAIKTRKTDCTQWLTVGSDALFAFNKATLSPDAEKTLSALGPLIVKAGKHPSGSTATPIR